MHRTVTRVASMGHNDSNYQIAPHQINAPPPWRRTRMRHERACVQKTCAHQKCFGRRLICFSCAMLDSIIMKNRHASPHLGSAIPSTAFEHPAPSHDTSSAVMRTVCPSKKRWSLHCWHGFPSATLISERTGDCSARICSTAAAAHISCFCSDSHDSNIFVEFHSTGTEPIGLWPK